MRRNTLSEGALGIVFLEFRDGVAASPFKEFSSMKINSSLYPLQYSVFSIAPILILF
jgi:hypothetical protein